MRPDATANDPIQRHFDDQTATGRATKQRPPERGVRVFERVGKPSPYAVEWRVSGKRKTEWFANSVDRDRRAAALRKERRANTLALVLSRTEVQEWTAFRAAIGNADWRDVVAAWRRGGGAPCSLTVAEMVERYVARQDELLAEGKIARVTHKKNCPKAKLFAAEFGFRLVSEVKAAEICEWIDDLGFEAAETFNTYRKVTHAVFESSREECPINPVSTIPLRSDQHDVGLITVEQTEALLAYAQKTYPEIVPRLALECFAGIRFSSALRLERRDINFEDQGITLPAHKLKTRRRHYIDGLPPNLFAWIGLETPATWCISAREYRRLKSACFDEANVPHPPNCLRHNFATYHLAAFKNPGLTATILCHRDQQLLWSTYNGRATQRDGLRYFELRPTR